MTYATQQDLIDRFGSDELKQLADRDNDGVVDTAVVDGALSDADELIDGYVGRRYALPLDPAPALVKRLAADVARYFLFKDAPTEVVAANYKNALALLKDIADGKANLDAAGSEPASAPGNVQVESQDRVFDRETLKGF